MTRSQIILIVVGLASVIFLFSLPKIIVKNNKQLTQEASKEADHESEQTVHTPKADEKDLKAIAGLRNQFLNFSDKEKKLKFADSLAGYFRKLHLYDSVLVYREAALKVIPSKENLLKAGDAYSEAYSVNPDNHKDYQNKARGYYEQALKLDPENNDIKSSIAMTYIGGNETMQGVKILLGIIEKDPKNEAALYNLGILAVQSGQYDKAVTRFTNLIQVNPAHGPGHFYLGMSYMQLGQKDKAKENFKKAKKLDEDPGFQATVDSYLKELN